MENRETSNDHVRRDEDGVPYDGADLDNYLREMGDEDLANLRLDTQESLNEVKNQILRATSTKRETGEWADGEWFRRVSAAKALYGTRILAICREQSRRRTARRSKLERQMSDIAFEVAFVRAAKLMLTGEQYAAVKQKAWQLIKKEL